MYVEPGPWLPCPWNTRIVACSRFVRGQRRPVTAGRGIGSSIGIDELVEGLNEQPRRHGTPVLLGRAPGIAPEIVQNLVGFRDDRIPLLLVIERDRTRMNAQIHIVPQQELHLATNRGRKQLRAQIE